MLPQHSRRCATFWLRVPCTVHPLCARSHFTCSFRRADCAAHQLSATMAMPASKVRYVLAMGMPSTDESVLHTLHRFDGIEIRTDHLAAQHGCLLEDCVQHPRHSHVDSEDRLSYDQVFRFNAARGLADDLVIFGILQPKRSEGRHGYYRRFRRQFLVRIEQGLYPGYK